MNLERPAPEVIAAIEAAVAWLGAVALKGVRVEEFADREGRRDRRLIADPAATCSGPASRREHHQLIWTR